MLAEVQSISIFEEPIEGVIVEREVGYLRKKALALY